MKAPPLQIVVFHVACFRTCITQHLRLDLHAASLVSIDAESIFGVEKRIIVFKHDYL